MGLQRTLLYTDESGGKLYQGNRYDVKNIEKGENYALVVLAAYDFQPQILTAEQAEKFEGSDFEELHDAEPELGIVVTPTPPKEIVRVPLTEPNNDEFIDHYACSHRPFAQAIALRACKLIKTGETVLSSCWGGVNRSSFVSAAILWHLGQGKMADLIKRLEEERCFSCDGLKQILLDAELRWIENRDYRKKKRELNK